MARGDCRERSRHKLWPSRRSFCIQRHQETGTLKKNFDNFLWFYLRGKMNPLHHNISMHILQTFLCTFVLMLIRRTSLTIESFLELVMIFIIHVSSMIVVGVILQGVNVSFNDAPLLQRNKMAPTAVVSENLSHLHM